MEGAEPNKVVILKTENARLRRLLAAFPSLHDITADRSHCYLTMAFEGLPCNIIADGKGYKCRGIFPLAMSAQKASASLISMLTSFIVPLNKSKTPVS